MNECVHAMACVHAGVSLPLPPRFRFGHLSLMFTAVYLRIAGPQASGESAVSALCLAIGTGIAGVHSCSWLSMGPILIQQAYKPFFSLFLFYF